MENKKDNEIIKVRRQDIEDLLQEIDAIKKVLDSLKAEKA